MVEGHAARGGHEARSRRDLLIPALHAVQSRIGWISQPALNYICRRLAVPPAEAYGVATFYALFATTPRPPVVAHVCDDIACRLAGAEDVCADLERALGPAGAPSADGARPGCGRRAWACASGRRRRWSRSRARNRRTFVAGPIDAAGVAGRLSGAIAPDADHGIGGEQDKSAAIATGVPQAGQAGLRLLARVGVVDPTSLDDYRAHGGFAALDRARRDRPRQRSSPRSTASKLMGRGGAAFPTGRKWAAVAQHSRPSRTTSSATPTSRSRARSRTASSRGRPVRGRRGDDDRRLRDRRGARATSTSAASTREAEARARERDRSAATRPLGDILGRASLRHRAPARRRRLHLRRGDGALRVDRGQARRAAQQAAVPGRGRAVRQADGRQQRRDAGQRPADRRDDGGARRSRAIGTEGSTGPKLFCLSGHVARAGRLRGRVRGDAGRPDRAGRRRPGGRAIQADPARRRGRASSSGPRRSTCR